MAQSLVVSHSPIRTYVDNATYYLPLGAGTLDNVPTVEAQVEIPVRDAGVFSNLFVYVPANTASVSSTFTLRKSRVDTALTVTYTADQTGVKEDTANSVAFAATDEVNFELTIPTEAGTNNLSLGTYGVQFTPDAVGDCISWLHYGGTSHTVSGASLTVFYPPVGRCIAAASANEGFRAVEIRGACTATNFYTNVSANSRTTDVIFGLRKNLANGNQSVTYTSGQTGAKEDTSNTDALVAGDDINYRATTSTGTQNITVTAIAMRLVSAAAENHLIAGEQNGFAVAFNTTIYMSVGGDIDTEATQANSQFAPRISVVAKELTANVSANSIATSDTVFTFMGPAATELTLTYTAGQTGQKVDSAHSAVVVGDGSGLMQHRVVTPNTSGSITVQSFGLIVAPLSVVVPPLIRPSYGSLANLRR
jgi:hypothetical protein